MKKLALIALLMITGFGFQAMAQKVKGMEQRENTQSSKKMETTTFKRAEKASEKEQKTMLQAPKEVREKDGKNVPATPKQANTPLKSHKD